MSLTTKRNYLAALDLLQNYESAAEFALADLLGMAPDFHVVVWEGFPREVHFKCKRTNRSFVFLSEGRSIYARGEEWRVFDSVAEARECVERWVF